jgi:hypothetical protein
MQHSPRFLDYTTNRVPRHQRLGGAEVSITRSDQTDAVAVAATLYGLAKARWQEADCERLKGVNI